MSPLSNDEQLRQRKAFEDAELERQRRRVTMEQRGLDESVARYWELLGEFIDRAEELGIGPETHESSGKKTKVEWVEGYRIRSGSIVTAPPLRYCLKSRGVLAGRNNKVLEVQELSIFVATPDSGTPGALSDAKTASDPAWPPFERWDRAANLLIAFEAELEASLIELMDSVEDTTASAPGV